MARGWSSGYLHSRCGNVECRLAHGGADSVMSVEWCSLRFLARRLAVCAALVLVSGLWLCGRASADEGLTPLGGTGGSATESPLVIPEAEVLTGNGVEEAQEAELASPDAVVAREVSQTAYSGLSAGEADALSQQVFPAVVDVPAGGPPVLPAGQHITGFVDGNVAQVDLGGEQHGLVESMVPMALASGNGGWAPVDLALSETSSGFAPKNPLVEVEFPKRLSDGLRIAGEGLSVTPLAEGGQPVGGGEGVVDGAAAFYASSATDEDTLVKPTSAGLEVDAILRSASSPQQLTYRVGLPAGGRLVQDGAGGAVRVVNEGTTIALVPAPHAQDAAGRSVPVLMSVKDDEIVLAVGDEPGRYQYPVLVDPEYNTVFESMAVYNWHFGKAGHGFTEKVSKELGYVEMIHTGSFPSNNWETLYEGSNGDSHIYEAQIHDSLFYEYVSSEHEYKESTLPYLRAEAKIANGGTVEGSAVTLSGAPYKTSATVCASSGCPASAGTVGNRIIFEVSTVEPSTGYPSEEWTYGGSLGKATETYIAQPKETRSTIAYNTSSPVIYYKSGEKTEETPNVLYPYNHMWVGPSSAGAFEFEAKDAGVGVIASTIELKVGSEWELVKGKRYSSLIPFQEGYESNFLCEGVQCPASTKTAATYADIEKYMAKTHEMVYLPNGEDKIRSSAHDAMAKTSSSEYGEGEATIKVDREAPTGISISGFPVKSGVFELGEVETHVKAEATDGKTGTPSSGIKGLELAVDGKVLGQAEGSCPAGPCTASGEWAINGAELGAGVHTLTVQAVDNASNYSRKTFTLVVYHASPVGMGPGSVNPESGDFALEAADVSISGGTDGLAVTRHYDSRNTTEGEEGPLGPQWAISLGSLASLEVLPDHSVMAIGSQGLTYFSKSGNSFVAPAGDTNLTLHAEENGAKEVVAYYLEDAADGSSTKFTLPEGAESWMPTVTEGPNGTNTTTDEYTTVEGENGKKIIEPVFEVAPHPNATCSKGKLEKGCRALEFVYTNEKTATGENESEWGLYPHRLIEVIFSAYNPAAGKVVATPVAAYRYDVKGWLRAEWDPSVPGELKTRYGYDSEKHVTALTRPGQETWAFTNGTIAGDLSPGRLLKATQAPASASLWTGVMPGDLGLPVLVGSPIVGVRMGVTNGVWSGNPVAYSYQWEDCNASSGGECTPIAGANNQNYTPTRSDTAHYLQAKVSAINGGGTVTVTTSRTSVRVWGTPIPAFSLKYGTYGEGNGQFKEPEGVAAEGSHVWVADTGNERVQEFNDAEGKITFLRQFGKFFGGSREGCLEPQYLVQPDAIVAYQGKVWVGEGAPGDCLKEYNEEGKEVQEKFGIPGGVYGVTVDSSGNVWYTVSGYLLAKVYEYNPTTKTQLQAWGTYGVGKGQFEGIKGIAVEHGHVYVNDGSKIQEFTETGTEVASFGEGPYGGWETTGANTLALDPQGNMWSAGYQFGVKGYNETGEFLTSFPESGLNPIAATVDTSGTYWLLEESHGEEGFTGFEEYLPGPKPTEGTKYLAQPGWTIEYNVPLQGTGAPYAMGVNETTKRPEPEKWGQHDDPVYATGIFPPDEPQGWPASGSKRETVLYMDNQARQVNTASPFGGISTAEFNEENQTLRTLSPDNRATALKEECKAEKECRSAEVAELLDTKSAYQEGRLTDTWGPQHLVKLVHGKEGKPEETLARNHVRYYYDEGAPENGETYELVTKTVDGAETSSKEEFDIRTATTNYSGQNNLGWKLRKATSATTDPGGLELVSTNTYDETTGNIVEASSPAATGTGPAVFSMQFGGTGTEPGQLKEPVTTAINSTGQVDVLDRGNSRIEQFSSTGTYKAKFGSSGSGTGQFKSPAAMALDPSTGVIWIADTGNNRLQELNHVEEGAIMRVVGSPGTGAGQFGEPKGITVSATGNVYVVDTNNNRVQELDKEGHFIRAFGFGVSNGEAKFQTCTSSCQAGIAGSGAGQFKEPKGITIDNGTLVVADSGNNRMEEFKENGEYLTKFGSVGGGNGQFKGPRGVAVNPRGDLIVSDTGNSRIQELTLSGTFLTTFGTKGTGEGQLEEPWQPAAAANGTIYIPDVKNNYIETWVGAPGAHLTKYIYYTSASNSTYPECGNHKEWQGLLCKVLPALQPATSKLPALPEKTFEYSYWDEKEIVTEKFGSVERKTKTSFDTTGRPLKTEVTSSNGHELSAVSNTYSETDGGLKEQSRTSEGETKTIITVRNKRGQLESYTDASGQTTKFTYESAGFRLLKVKDPSDEGKGEETLSYDKTTGGLTSLTDIGAGAFTGSYDVQGEMTSESYPNGLTVYYTRNPVGAVTNLEYKKVSACGESCTWFKDTITPGIHGETLKQASTLAEEPNYVFNAAGWLTEAQEIPVGEGCTTRSYGYEQDGNRTSLTTRKSTEAKCPTEGGTTETHALDTADRLIDPGVIYEPFGNIATLPAADAGGSPISSEYYVNSQIYKQTQNEETSEYKLDPENRTLETKMSGKTTSTTTSHYDGPGGSASWTSEPGKWGERNIPGIDGSLTAIQTGPTTSSITLQLHDIQGNIVATAADNTTETKLLGTYNSTEFGTPNSKGAPPKRSWQGTTGLTTDETTGRITQDGITYVPQTGRGLQAPESLAPGLPSDNNTAYVSPEGPPWIAELAATTSANATAKREQEIAERESANAPPGEMPVPSAGGATPGGGEIGGCSGMHACAASKHNGVVGYSEHGNGYLGCSIWGSWGSGEFLASEISGWGHWECELGYAATFEMQIAAYAYIEGVWYVLGENTHPITHTWEYTSSGVFEHTWKCPKTGSYYHLWFWGREAGVQGRTQWAAAGWERRIGGCTYSGTVDMSPVGQAGEK